MLKYLVYKKSSETMDIKTRFRVTVIPQINTCVVCFIIMRIVKFGCYSE